jgi:hypothetical protein
VFATLAGPGPLVPGQRLPRCSRTTGVGMASTLRGRRKTCIGCVVALGTLTCTRADTRVAFNGAPAHTRAVASGSWTLFETAILAASLLAETTRSAESVASEAFQTAPSPVMRATFRVRASKASV